MIAVMKNMSLKKTIKKPKCTGVILAGGINRRLPGKKKALRKVDEIQIIERIYTVFSLIFDEIILVVNEPEAFCEKDITIVTDIHPSRCSLAGIHAGLYYASNDYAYITACDTPFISSEIIKYMLGQIDPEIDVLIPRTDDGLEPLSAVYSKKCIPLVEKNLEKSIYKIKRFFEPKYVKEIPAHKLKRLDPRLQFAFNINTPDDLILANMMTADKRKIV